MRRAGRIATLRRRFVLYAMAAVACVLLAVGLAVNFAYGASVTGELDAMLTLIAQGQGSLPRRSRTAFDDYDRSLDRGSTLSDEGADVLGEGDASVPNGSVVLGDDEGELDHHDAQGSDDLWADDVWEDWDFWEDWGEPAPLSGLPRLTPETAYATRWFSVTYDGSGKIAWVDLANIASVDQDDLPRFVEVAASSGDGFGTLGDFRYLVTSTTGYHQAYFLDASTEFHAGRTLALLTLGVGVVAFALISLAVWFLAGRAVRPVAEADARQRRFITDASHELKTPLATILTSLGVAEMDTGPSPFIDKAKAQTGRMAELVDELVTYARIDEGEDREPATFDASAATEDVASGFVDKAALTSVSADSTEASGTGFAGSDGLTGPGARPAQSPDAEPPAPSGSADEAAPQAGEVGAEPTGRAGGIDLHIAPGLAYLGDEYGYRRLVSVLLDNATKYAAPGGPIRLSLTRYRRRGLRLVCENPVEDMDEAQLPHLFERFYRPDDSRSRETGGFGIGLSIAREVVEQADGSIAATLQPPATPDAPQTIRFEALLP